ncbi:MULTISPECIES: ArsR/SmtB family transcription factor [Kocuria]|uniref:ArsR/SmtB family transcription factor n=1 Tax=Kocuria TaxID=57493 RepID=UPI0008A649E4|nr:MULTISPECIES: metalloregulator ArsR/SmtB family transcription factor [Kocuria]MCT1958282.1 metalloregulator ArsR/SmtB family transcription factor [Kocuria rhizophila]MCT2074271.1 metalloregulator ArsR/SmtB family transcription factor [Kocuria rhizophila]MCT2248979.1 metalloregulator ArsR/SmtB family transcription factor [Kocuria rhizophila]MDR7374173.1 ArsR family transcriptional regulator [Kocuria rhizophila]OFK06902.1 hypothetical protein HMPREF2833_02780 [Kocuria sp. HMSC066H03]
MTSAELHIDNASDGVERSAAVFKALADPVRLRLYLAIRKALPGSICVCDLPDFDLSQATISHHLRKLREAGLVSSRRQGTWVHYTAQEGVFELAVDSVV